MSRVKLTINGQELECDAGLNLIEAAALIGVEIPHFCWHPDLSVAGNCRMCTIEVDFGKGPIPTIACNTRVANGLKVYTDTPGVLKMRRQILELLFLNHPLDCPICDKAGECKLQDFYQLFGLYKSRLDDRIEKVAKGVKAKRISDKIVFDNERCVLCDRCVRFLREVEGNEDLYIGGRGTEERIVAFPGKPITSERQLCLADICPVGALTAEDFRFKKRVWFLEKTPGVCGRSDKGDTIFIEHQQGIIHRVTPRRHDGINGVWVSDKTRLAFREWQANRCRSSRLAGKRVEIAEALDALASSLSKTKSGVQAILILDNRLTLEEAYALKKLFTLLGSAGVFSAESVLAEGKGPNGYGLEKLSIRPFGKVDKLETASVLAVGDLRPEFLAKFEKAGALALVQAHETESAQDALLKIPLIEHPERKGTFVNNQPRLQRAHRAFAPAFPALSGLEIAVELARRLGLDLGFQDSEGAFAEIAEKILKKPGMRWKDLGDFGLLLDGEEHPRVNTPLGKHGRMTWSG